jgi:hypothetical protein
MFLKFFHESGRKRVQETRLPDDGTEGPNVTTYKSQARKGAQGCRVLHRIAWAVFTAGALAKPAWADPPPQIEMWHGVRRVDVPLPVAREMRQTELTPPAAPVAARDPVPVEPPAPLPPAVLAAEPAPVRPRAAAPTPGVIVLGNYSPSAETQLDSLVRHAVATSLAEKETVAARAENPRDRVPSAAPRGCETSCSDTEPSASSTTHSGATDLCLLLEGARLPLLCIGTALVLLPLVGTAVLLVLLRRLTSGPLFRIEYINNQPATAYPGVILGTPPTGAAPPKAPPPATATSIPDPRPEAEPTGERFELGPTFEQELQQRKQHNQRQEQAVLQQLFEDNLKLRDALQRAQPVAA